MAISSKVGGKRREGRDPELMQARLLRAVCGCGRIIRASRKVFASAPITCGSCGEAFELAPTEREKPGLEHWRSRGGNL